jgi:transposase-like protein
MPSTTAELIAEENKRDQRGRRITPAPRRLELVEAYRLSGLTMKQFARQEGINPLTLAKWSTDIGRRPRPAMQFAEMKLGMPVASGWAFEVTLPGGVLVKTASAAALGELLAMVRT